MTSTPQPHPLAWIVRHVGDLAGTLGGGFNVIVILWLLAVRGRTVAREHARRQLARSYALIVGCVVFWVVGEDVAIFGGVGTDINSLIPLRGADLVRSTRGTGRAAIARVGYPRSSLEHRIGGGRVRHADGRLFGGVHGRRVGVGRRDDALRRPERPGRGGQHEGDRLHLDRPVRLGPTRWVSTRALHPC